MALFPPWVLVFEGPSHTKRFAGYHPLWESNTPTDEAALAKLFSMEVAHPKYFSIEVDVARLTIQIVTLLIVTIFLVVVLNNQKEKLKS